tara:strand:+ start:6349 stop:6795 length:447 start_codon:yes stop_codon:yes gene_type:complete
MKTIELGSTVSCPVTDGDGENSFRMGTLVDMNSRYATVKTSDGETFKIGKTKIEFVSVAVKEKPETTKSGLARAADYDYEPCTAASGKKSKDNNDGVAQELRGQTLDFAYTRAAEYLEKTETDLRSRYNHLNPGQQRMCLGNLIRGAK